jgi:ribosome-binding factor A
MPKDYPRSDRVADEIQRQLAETIRHELKDPGVAEFFTISEVEVTRDLSVADVHFTVLEAESVEPTLDALQRARGFLRKRLASKLRLRNTPQLRFHYDRSVDEGARMDRLIDAARRRDSPE